MTIQTPIAQLQAIARECRVQIERMITHAGSGHPGGSNSVIDLLVALYFGRLRVDCGSWRSAQLICNELQWKQRIAVGLGQA